MYLDLAQKSQTEPSHRRIENSGDAKPNPNEQLQVCLYATIATSLLKFILESNNKFDISNLHHAMAAVMQAMAAIVQAVPVNAREAESSLNQAEHVVDFVVPGVLVDYP